MPLNAPHDPLLTPPEFAARIRTAEKTLEVWRSTKEVDIPYVKIGRLVRYRESTAVLLETEGTAAFRTNPRPKKQPAVAAR
jgi:hypothetical protein